VWLSAQTSGGIRASQKPKHPRTYPKYHRNRVNLLIHLVAVPLFVASVFGTLWFALQGDLFLAVALLIGPAIPLASQGYGHKLEETPPIPFSGPGNYIKHILIEQFLSFPRFVISGGWLAAFRAKNGIPT
jgi:hypothetical protein